MDWFLDKVKELAVYGREKAVPAAIILVVGIFAIRLVLRLLRSVLEKAKMERAVIKLVRSTFRVILYVLLLVIVASTLGINVTGVVALASVLTLAISLSVQNTLTNVIGGFTLLSNKPFTTGDFVEIAAQSGTVKEVGLTYTKLCTGDNKTISIPNNAVVSAEIVNYTVAGTRRVDVNISVSCATPAEAVLEALQAAAMVPTALADPASFAAVKSYEGGTANYVLQAWCKTEDYWPTLYAINKNVKTEMEARSLQITSPHLHVHMDQ